ncbi:MAG TPA: hypothetical protein VF429_07230 [Anaerolineae bacterium]|jgi:hypothetical protein
MKTVREIKEHYIVDKNGKHVGVVLDHQVYQDLLAELKSLRANAVKPRPARGKNGKRGTSKRTRRPHTIVAAKTPVSERDRITQILRDAGMLAELDPELKRQAAEWRALPEERKQAVIDKLRTIHLDPPLSQTIIEDRG